MQPRRAIYGQIGKAVQIPNKGPEVIGIDSEILLSRLFLFDEVVVDSINLGELPYLAKMFGVEGLKELINRGMLKLASEKARVITDIKMNGVRQIPLLQFDEGIATAKDNDHNLGMKLGSLRKISGLSNSDRERLSDLIREKVLRLSPSYGDDLLSQVRKDLTTAIPLMKSLLIRQNPGLKAEDIELKVHELGKMQRFETNLQSKLNISAEREHEMLMEVVKGIGTLNQRIADMAEYHAISHFEDNDAPFLFGKVHSVVAQLNPAPDENAFLKIIEIAGIPKLVEDKRIDIEKLIKIKETDECRAFSDWLSTTDSVSDADLERLLNGFRAKAALFVASNTGKAMRLGVNIGLGLIPGYGALAGAAEGVVDTFLLDKMLPTSGVLTFLHHKIPSIFK